MASKLAVAGIIEGNFTDEGLAAMSDCQDMTTALARELTQGIRNEVEDLSAVFKKMAILKPETDIENTEMLSDVPNVIELESSEWDELTTSSEAVDITGVADIPTAVPTTPVLYAPPKQQSIEKSAQSAYGFPDDFDPFAEDFEPFMQSAA